MLAIKRVIDNAENSALIVRESEPGDAWVKRWQAWGVVAEEPVGDGGPAYVRKDGESIAEHVSAGQLEVAKEAA